jgi:hypothetical protein
VFWNRINISHFSPEKRYAEKIDISWESRSGERFRIEAFESPSVFGPQYDFLLDNTSIFSRSHISELTPRVPVGDRMDTSVRSDSEDDTLTEGTTESNDVPIQNLGFRLSMAGFAPPGEQQDGLVDDLTPTSFTNVLESLRRSVTELVPNSEDMVSRAIIGALSEDQFESNCYSRQSTSSLESVPTAMEIEANAILDTTDWINLNVQYAPRPDVEYQKRAFMQKQMASVFMNALHGHLEEASAARILSDIATLLGLTANTIIPRDTVILSDLDKSTYSESLIVALCVYGEIREVAIATGHRGGKLFAGLSIVHQNLPGQHILFELSLCLSWLLVALCRFSSESGPLRALVAAERGLLSINGKRPKLYLLEKRLLVDRPDLGRRSISTPWCGISPAIPKPSFGRRRSHNRNTLSIDTLISETPPFLLLVNESTNISQLETSSYAPTSGFDKINSSTESSEHQFDLSGFGKDLPTVSPDSDRKSATAFI